MTCHRTDGFTIWSLSWYILFIPANTLHKAHQYGSPKIFLFCLFMALYNDKATVLSMTNKDVPKGSWNNLICGFFFYSNVSEFQVRPWMFSWRLISIDSVYDLGSYRRQNITWINGNPVHICICASPALNTSSRFFANPHTVVLTRNAFLIIFGEK